MPRRPKTPVTFDEHLGSVIDGAIAKKGGRPAVAQWLGISERSVERRMRGEVEIFTSELAIIAEHIGWTVDELVNRALKDYGGIEKLIGESVSAPLSSLDAQRKRRQAEAAALTTEQIEDDPRVKKVAETDDERQEDEPPTP